jgi:hypothetical protein
MKLLNPKTEFLQHTIFMLVEFLPTPLLPKLESVTKIAGLSYTPLSHTHIHISVDTRGNPLCTSTHTYEMGWTREP